MRIELLDGAGGVTGTILADAVFAEAHYAGTWRAAAEQQEAAIAPRRWLTVLGFRNRFTQTEKVAIEIASLDIPTALMPQRAQAAALRASQKDCDVATYIDLDRPDTRAGVRALEAAGVIAAGRADAILDAPIAAVEAFKG